MFIDHQGKRKSKKIGKDKRLAQEVAKKIEARLVSGDIGLIEDKSSPLFREYANQWIDVHVPVKCKPNTIKDYRSILERYILPYFGEKLITDINRLMVKNFLMNKIKEGHSQHIVHKIKVIIGNVINLALDDGSLTSNPIHRLGNIYGKKKLNVEKDSVHEIDTLTREELSLFL